MMKGLIVLAVIYFLVSAFFGSDSAEAEYNDNDNDFDNIVYVEDDNYVYVGADGHQIKLINNHNATDPTYEQVRNFLKTDYTDDIHYNDTTFVCGDFAEQVHNNAEAAGLKCGWVNIDFTYGSGHACNVFNTTDEGLVFIDCTEADKKVDINIGKHYIPERLSKSNTEYMSMGIVNDYDIFW